MEVDWDLHAVVRGCNNTAAAAAAPATTTSAANRATTTPVKDDFDCKSWSSPFGGSEQSGHLFSLADPFEARNAIEELHELCKPFFPKSQEPLSPNSIICSKPVAPLFKQQQPKQPHGGGSLTNSNTANSHHTPRSKRRKNQLKRVCQVPAEGLSADVWAWRKYGQKPIKGSPYPRGYYRCSSSKGCLARKQVERNRSDPNMFIVTYTAEHNHLAPTHRNSLAGSTRQKPVTPQTITASDSNKTPSSPSAKPTLSSSSPGTSLEEEAVPQSTKTESREIEMVDEEEDDDFGLSEVGISDDFFVGLEGFASEQRFSDDFPASFELPWTANNAATAASSI